MNIEDENTEDNNEEEHNEEDKNEGNMEQFSDDPEEQFRIENELLRIQLQAETGADIHELSNVPPEVENIFLNNILAFERQMENLEKKTIYNILGEPKDFRKESELSDVEIESELIRLEELMGENGIAIGYGTYYPARVKYKFITEELFEEETQQFDIPDLVNHFIYEDFHPNYQLDMQNIATDFLEKWLNRHIEEDCWELAEILTSNQNINYTRKEVLGKIQHIFDAYLRFDHASFHFEEISFEEKSINPPLIMGKVNGNISYDAILENQETLQVSESFTLYIRFTNGYWEIYNLSLPGLVL